VFDFYQSLYPRVRRTAPVVIVAIDEESLRRYGQWPWPRKWLAELVHRIADAQPAVIGIDILMPEADRLSPARLPELVGGIDRDTARRLSSLPSNETILAQALRGARVVLGLAGLETVGVGPARTLPPTHFVPFRADPVPFVRRFEAALFNVDEIDEAGVGHGLTSVDLEGGVVRRLSLVAAVGGKVVPAFGLEMLRVAKGVPALFVHVGSSGVDAVEVGNLVVPTEPDGSVWVHYSRHDPTRFISAAEVLGWRTGPGLFEGKLVLVGVTALGLADHLATPVVDHMSGVEIHAQLIESILEGDMILRPRSAPWFELGVLLLVGVAMLCVFDRAPVWVSMTTAVTLVISLVGVPVGLFRQFGILLDPVPAIITVVALLGQQSLEKVNRLARLKRFFSPQLAELIVEGGTDDPLASHRREVTVVFLDLRGFTAFADTTDPTEVMGVLHEYQTEMGRLVLAYEGTLERFTGDGMMIFFNDPVPMPDATERAIRMAEAMRERVRLLDVGWRQRGYSLGFGIGIAQGHATLGAIGFEGRWDYAAIGTVTNLAARLCGEAQSEQILISQGLAEAVTELASLEALGALTLKGFSRPLPVFNLLALKSRS